MQNDLGERRGKAVGMGPCIRDGSGKRGGGPVISKELQDRRKKRAG